LVSVNSARRRKPKGTKRDDTLRELTRKGFRVLAMGYKVFPAGNAVELASMQQDDLEVGIRFLGFLKFSNSLKAETASTFEALHAAKIYTNMITGDHVHTAVAIAGQCGLLESSKPVVRIDVQDGALVTIDQWTDKLLPDSVQELVDKYDFASAGERTVQVAMTGPALAMLKADGGNQELLQGLLKMTVVFARMQPHDKKFIVDGLKEPTRFNNQEVCHVLFCGDGANDMEALSAASLGISLCDEVTTVAASVVSTDQTPYAVVDVLKEGRCSLCTAFCLVNFNIMYAIIQLFMTCYLNNIGLVFSDYVYLIQDFFFSLLLGLAIGSAGPSEQLSAQRAPPRLFVPWMMAKLLPQLAIFAIFQYITLQILYSREAAWYGRYEVGDDPLTDSFAQEQSALNALCLAQLQIAAIVVSINYPFRVRWFLKPQGMAVLAGQFGWILYLLFTPQTEFGVWIGNQETSVDFAFIVLGIIGANFFVSGVASKAADFLSAATWTGELQ
jgi:cation-transporting ATPase 13A2